MKKASVLFLMNSFGIGGTEKAVQIWAKYLKRLKVDVHVGALNGYGPRKKYFENLKIPTVIFQTHSQILEYIKLHNIKVVHIQYIHVPLEYLNDCKVLFHHHFSQPIYSNEDQEQMKYLVFNSHRTRQKYLEITHQELNAQKHIVVYSPIDFEEFEANLKMISGKRITELKTKFSINDNDFVIGRLGRPDIVKWGDFLIEAFPTLFKLLPNCKVILFSAPKSREFLLKISPWRKHFIFPKFSDLSIEEFFNLIDVYVHSSKIGESFGLTLVEAMAAKKPVVVNSTPYADNAQIEVVDHEKTGFIATLPAKFARNVKVLSQSRQQRIQMGQKGYTKAKLYTGIDEASQLKALYFNDISSTAIKQNQSKYEKYAKNYDETLKMLQKKEEPQEQFAYKLRSPFRIFCRVCDTIEFFYQKRSS